MHRPTPSLLAAAAIGLAGTPALNPSSLVDVGGSRTGPSGGKRSMKQRGKFSACRGGRAAKAAR